MIKYIVVLRFELSLISLKQFIQNSKIPLIKNLIFELVKQLQIFAYLDIFSEQVKHVDLFTI